jgi:hypothetical protein
MEDINKKDLSGAKISDEELKEVSGGRAPTQWEIEYQQKLQKQLEEQWMAEAEKRRQAEEYSRQQQIEFLQSRGLG